MGNELNTNPFTVLNTRGGLIAALLWVVLMACSNFSEAAEPAVNKGASRAQLSIGYSLLYQEAVGIPKLKWLLMFKETNSEMSKLTKGLVSYYQGLADSMLKLSRQYPGMRIDAAPMSEIESEARKAIGTDEAKDMAPLIGKVGTEFERQTLLMFYDALNEQRHLVGVMVARETDPGLGKFLQATKAQLDAHHAKVGELLNRRYFTH